MVMRIVYHVTIIDAIEKAKKVDKTALFWLYAERKVPGKLVMIQLFVLAHLTSEL